MTGHLRERGHDVSTVPEEELCGAEDQAVFVAAAVSCARFGMMYLISPPAVLINERSRGVDDG